MVSKQNLNAALLQSCVHSCNCCEICAFENLLTKSAILSMKPVLWRPRIKNVFEISNSWHFLTTLHFGKFAVKPQISFVFHVSFVQSAYV